MELKKGGTYGDIIVEPNQERVHLEVWPNQVIEVIVYSDPQPNEDPSDRIHLIITDADGHRAGWLMNIDDASAVVDGLSAGIRRAVELGVPERPEGE